MSDGDITPPNGAGYPRAESVSGELDTGPMRPVLAGGDNPPSIEAVAQALAGLLGGAGGGVPPDVHVKRIKRHNWAAFVGVLATSIGGITAAYYATDHRSKANEEAAKVLRVEVNEHDAAIKANTRGMVQIKYKIDDIATQQTAISDGIGELKKESVDSLKRELREARRELRQRE